MQNILSCPSCQETLGYKDTRVIRKDPKIFEFLIKLQRNRMQNISLPYVDDEED